MTLKSINVHSNFQSFNICNFIIIIKCSDVSFKLFQLSNTEVTFTDLSLLNALKDNLNLRNNKTLYNSSYHNYNRQYLLFSVLMFKFGGL